MIGAMRTSLSMPQLMYSVIMGSLRRKYSLFESSRVGATCLHLILSLESWRQ